MPRKRTARIKREIDEVLAGSAPSYPSNGPDKFARVNVGTLVRRSSHWYREHGTWGKGQLGILTDKKVYQEDGHLVTWPLIHWEGDVMPSLTHPDNAEVAPSTFTRGARTT